MEKTFEYMATQSFLADIHIDNIGNTIIQANDDWGRFFYLWVKTDDGFTKILELGPYCTDPDLQEFVKKFNFNYERFDYSESKIIKRVTGFLNSYNSITQAIEISEEELREKCKLDIFCFMKG